jgi:PncC family amidohydrolase
MKQEYKFFKHQKCEYFPCHKTDSTEDFNCLFCYCPLYKLEDRCGGNFTYLDSGIKDCSNCMFPHRRENYEKVMEKLQELYKSNSENETLADEIEVRKKYEKLTKRLIQKKLTITTMESITCGQIASLITDTQGASAVLKGAYVTYSNEAKIKQGVSAETIENYGVYSKETARAMAAACKQSYGADIGIGITGSTGNVDPNNQDSIPGQVYFAIAFGEKIQDGYFEMGELLSRIAYKMYAANEVVELLFKLVEEI